MGLLRASVTLALLTLITGKMLLREPVQHMHNVSSNCVPVKADPSGATYTLTAKVGGHPVHLVIDTGSPYVLIMSTKAPGAKDIGGGELEITYGSGSVLVHKVKDELQVGPNDFDVTMYLADKQTVDFPEIDGIYPLGAGAYRIIDSNSFSVCFSGKTGNLAFGASGASVNANSKWEAQFTGITVNGANVGVSSKFLPDTGTTLLIAPLNHIDKLFAALCTQWSNCEGTTSIDFINSVRNGCRGNLPPIEFSMAGTKISLSSNEYLLRKGGKCDVAFTYGDEWILGIPLFQAYTVVFDYTTTKIGFHPGCGCGGSLKENHKSAAPHLKLNGPPRISPFRKPQPQLTAHEASNVRLVELAQKLSLDRFQEA